MKHFCASVAPLCFCGVSLQHVLHTTGPDFI